MYNNEIESSSLGKMKILANIKDIALIERLCDAPQKYVVGVGFDKENISWGFGIYHSELSDALNTFNEKVASRINIITLEERKMEQLNKTLYILENVKDEYDISEGYDQFLKNCIGLDEKEITSYNNYAEKLDIKYPSIEDFIVAELNNSKERNEKEMENIDAILSKFETDIDIENILKTKMQNNTLTKKEMENLYEEIETMMKSIKEDFKMLTENDSNLKKYFENTNSKDTFSSIMVASAILGGIQIRNFQRENNNLDGEKEESPYNKEQIKLIDRYNKFQEIIDDMQQYAEQNFEENMEM